MKAKVTITGWVKTVGMMFKWAQNEGNVSLQIITMCYENIKRSLLFVC